MSAEVFTHFPSSSLKALWNHCFHFLSLATTKQKWNITLWDRSNKDQCRQPGLGEIEMPDLVWEMSLLFFPLWDLPGLMVHLDIREDSSSKERCSTGTRSKEAVGSPFLVTFKLHLLTWATRSYLEFGSIISNEYIRSHPVCFLLGTCEIQRNSSQCVLVFSLLLLL